MRVLISAQGHRDRSPLRATGAGKKVGHKVSYASLLAHVSSRPVLQKANPRERPSYQQLVEAGSILASRQSIQIVSHIIPSSQGPPEAAGIHSGSPGPAGEALIGEEQPPDAEAAAAADAAAAAGPREGSAASGVGSAAGGGERPKRPTGTPQVPVPV